MDRPPVALWRHFPGDDQRPEDLAAATVAFQREYDFDFVKVTPASSYCLRGWGAVDEWVGSLEGTREFTDFPVSCAEDWCNLPVLDPRTGALGAQMQALEMIVADLGPEVPVIQTIFSPLAQAKNLAGATMLPIHLRRHREEFAAGLAVITETTVRFVEALREVGVAGVFYAVQQARYSLLSEGEFADMGRPYDLQILESSRGFWLNVLHLHGTDVMFDLVADYPVHVINWHDQETWPSLGEGQRRFGGAVCGGLLRWDHLVRGTPDQIQEAAQVALNATEGRGFVLGTGCVTPIVAPHANLRAARQSVDTWRPGS